MALYTPGTQFNGGMNNPKYGGSMANIFNGVNLPTSGGGWNQDQYNQSLASMMRALMGSNPFGGTQGFLGRGTTPYTPSYIENPGAAQWQNVSAPRPYAWQSVNSTNVNPKDFFGNSSKSQVSAQNVTAPGAVDWERVNAANLGVDPMASVRAALPFINEQQDTGFANAASKFGRLGTLMSGGNGAGYTDSLGQVARKSANDIASLTENTMLTAAENQAARAMQAALANQQTGYSANESAASRAMQAALANQGAGLQAAIANQNADQSGWSRMLQAALANQSGNLQAQMANQQTGAQAGALANQQALQAALQNSQGNYQSQENALSRMMQSLLANQQAGYQGAALNNSNNLQAAGIQSGLESQQGNWWTQFMNMLGQFRSPWSY